MKPHQQQHEGSIRSSVWTSAFYLRPAARLAGSSSTHDVFSLKLRVCTCYQVTKKMFLLKFNPTFSYAIPVLFLRGNIWPPRCSNLPPRSSETTEAVFWPELSRWCTLVSFLGGNYCFVQKAAGCCYWRGKKQPITLKTSKKKSVWGSISHHELSKINQSAAK